MGRPAKPEPLSPRRVLTAVCIPITEYLDSGMLLDTYNPISLKMPLAPLPNISIAVPSLPRKKKGAVSK